LKNNLDYYSHDANSHNHPKFKLLRSKFGWEGEGKFWALNNIIANSDQCILQIHKKYVEASTADDLDFTLDQFRQFIDFLTTEAELLINLDGNITTEIVRDTYREVKRERIKARERKLKSSSAELSESSTKLFKISGE